MQGNFPVEDDAGKVMMVNVAHTQVRQAHSLSGMIRHIF
jgi:hypothetical protein